MVKLAASGIEAFGAASAEIFLTQAWSIYYSCPQKHIKGVLSYTCRKNKVQGMITCKRTDVTGCM